MEAGEIQQKTCNGQQYHDDDRVTFWRDYFS